ncbi:MAG: cysteine--tRNA ligase [Alphaproteobacteria bacterium GM7ARS4]|nr:cysteine--tRNA ligase [Alphaproteobacteria bacterium GM7ARS4]
MTLTLYHHATKKKKPFHPIEPSHVRLYVCGPTVYDDIHIGNARPMVVFDVLVRLLRRLFPRVTYARNITDVDDKIIQRAQQTQQTPHALAQQMTDLFHQRMEALHVAPPDLEPRATDHMDAIHHLIGALLKSGHAYEACGHVLFHVPSLPDYGALSGRTTEHMRAGERVDVSDYKRSPLDFVLWKPSKKGEPAWTSPWGDGRPGWHIECSAMSHACLKTPFDIHGGGIDLLFPHHENEQAQSCCGYHTDVMAQFWLHNGSIEIGDAKMSKSLGNDIRLGALLQEHPTEALRYFLLQTHYRQPIQWHKDALAQARSALDTLYHAIETCHDDRDDSQEKKTLVPCDVTEALLDDMNTPLAFAHLHKHGKNLRKDVTGTKRTEALRAFSVARDILAIITRSPKEWFQTMHDNDQTTVDMIESLIKQRVEAKTQRNYDQADAIRTQLHGMGIAIEDKADGSVQWKRRIQKKA